MKLSKMTKNILTVAAVCLELVAFACVIFGGANPKKAYLAALMFGFFDALGYRLQEYDISSNLTSMIPYVITVCMMVYVVVRSNKKKPVTA